MKGRPRAARARALALPSLGLLVLLAGSTPSAAREVSVEPAQAWFSERSGHGQAVVTVWYDDEGQSSPAVRGYRIEITYPQAYARVAGIAQGDFLSGGGTVAFFSSAEGGRITVNAAILGSTGGATGSGTLFTVTLDGQGAAEGCGDLEFDAQACVIRDVQNNDLPASYAGGWIAFDASGPQPPALGSPSHPEGETTAAGVVDVQWGAVTDLPAGCASGVDGYYLAADQNPATAPGPGLHDLFVADGGACEGSFELPDGEGYYIHIAAYDAVGNPSLVDHYGPFGIDTLPPGDVSGMQAASGHNRVTLSWVPPADASIVRIYRQAWSYPYYDDAMPKPQPPAFAGDGALVGEYPIGTTEAVDTFTDLERNYYVYTAFAFDAAGNGSAEPAPASAQDWALSYWLGDFDDDYTFDCVLGGYDGRVDAADLNAFSAVFGLYEGQSGYCAEMDVGPTSDNLETGYPLTDGEIGFEDLMVFSLTFGSVAPRGLAGQEATSGTEEAQADGRVPGGRPRAREAAPPAQPVLALLVEPDSSAPDGLLNMLLAVTGGAGLKGLRAEIGFDDRELEFAGLATAGLLSGAADFVASRPGAGRVEVDIARLGREAVIEGDGTLARLRFRRLTATATLPALEEVEARGARNERLAAGIAAPEAPDPGTLPERFAFRGAEPNPARGAISFGFALPEAAPVTLEVLDVSGRRVRLLLDSLVEAGDHRRLWDGRDAQGSAATSGLYLARLRAGAHEQTRQFLWVR